MNTTKIVFLGAGSMSFGTGFFKDLFSSGELAGSTLTLVDVDGDNLSRMYELALRMNEVSGAGLKIERTSERREAFPGAGFIVNSIAIERSRLWKHDFEIPRKYGIRQTLGENGGPGGLFFTMRTLPLIMDFMRDIEELCPDAYFINFSNPESRIILALGRYTKIRNVGLCHGVFMGQASVAKMMGMTPAEVEVMAAGLNHFQWLLEVREKATGADLYPLLRQKEPGFDPSFEPLSRRLFKAFGCFPSCSDSHIGEFLPYGWEGGEKGYDFAWDERYRGELKEEIRARTSGKKPLEDWLAPSGEKAVSIITGILHNIKRWIESGIVYNRGVITNLPADCAVEVPLLADGSGIHPVHVGALPDGIARLLAVQAGVQQMTVDAAAQGSKELALQALLVDPVVTTIQETPAMLDELWEINKAYIRKCVP